jgi:hypothetical protein
MPVLISDRLHLTRAAFGAALALALCVGGIATKVQAQAQAPAKQDDEEVEDTVDTKWAKSFLKTLGLMDGSEKGIDYHERSPLVVPPTINLPPPETANTALNNPAWPKDADLKREAAAKKKRKVRTTSEDEAESMRMLTASEMAPIPRGKRERPDGPSAQNGPGGSRPEQLTPSQLGSSGNWFSSIFEGREGKEVKFEKEPERQALTDPPVGLRTPSPRYSYGTKGRLDPTKEVGRDQAVFGVDK